jgi:ribosomal protein S8
MLYQLIANLNAGYRRKFRYIDVPNTILNVEVLNNLKANGLIFSFEVFFDNPKLLRVTLILDTSKIIYFHIKAVSKPSFRKYVKGSLQKKSGSPFFLISTTKGLLSPATWLDSKSHLGGELLLVITSCG